MLLILGTAAACLASLLGASEWLVRTRIQPADPFVRHRALFEHVTARQAAFGDSHVARGFDAAAPVVNLAYPSENIAKMAYKLDAYLARVDRPRTILLQADAHLFSAYRLDPGIGDYPGRLGAEMPPSAALSDAYRPQLLALWGAFLKGGGHVSASVEMTAQGTQLSRGDLSRWPGTLAATWTSDRVTLHRPLGGDRFDAAAADYSLMVEKSLAAGARVCLVRFPVSPAYRAERASRPLAERADWRRADAFIEALALQDGVRLLDHSALYDDPSVYRDPDHLNAAGARAYGPVLQEACFGEEPLRMAGR